MWDVFFDRGFRPEVFFDRGFKPDVDLPRFGTLLTFGRFDSGGRTGESFGFIFWLIRVDRLLAETVLRVLFTTGGPDTRDTNQYIANYEHYIV